MKISHLSITLAIFLFFNAAQRGDAKPNKQMTRPEGKIEEFKNTLRWNELFYHLANGLG